MPESPCAAEIAEYRRAWRHITARPKAPAPAPAAGPPPAPAVAAAGTPSGQWYAYICRGSARERVPGRHRTKARALAAAEAHLAAAERPPPGPAARAPARRRGRFIGVRRNPSGTWQARISGRRGSWEASYATEEEAARARDAHARRLLGPGARLNFPES